MSGSEAERASGARLRTAGLLLAVIALPWSGGGLNAGIALAFVGHLMCGWRPRPALAGVATAACLALAAVFLASSLWSEDLSHGLKETKGLWPLLGMVACTAAVRTARAPRVFLWAWLASAATAALWLLGWKVLEPGLSSRDLPVNRWRLNLALTHALACAALLAFGAGDRRARALTCAGALVIGAALATFGERAPLLLAAAMLGATTLALALDSTQPRAVRRLALAALAAGILAVLANPATRAILGRTPAESFAGESHRLTLWNAAWKTWQAAPLLGTGIGDASADIEAFVHGPLGHPEMPAVHAHSNLLQLMAGAGVLGGATYLVFAAALLAPLLARSRRRSPGTFLAGWAWAFLVLGGLLECTILQSYFLIPFALLYALGIGMRDNALTKGST